MVLLQSHLGGGADTIGGGGLLAHEDKTLNAKPVANEINTKATVFLIKGANPN
jgi:hypothetical protein